MKAIRVHQTGGPGVLEYEEVQTPVPRAGEALVRLAAVGVNFIDINHRMGRYPLPLPFTPGLEASGTVVDVAPDVKGFAVGDRVGYADVVGAYAEFAAVRADRLVALPAGLDFEQATAAMLQGMTAESLTTAVYPLREGHNCLVHAAAGGVGLLLCQMANRRGARVIGTVSTAAKAEVARAAGADHVIL
jgi:NADPH2:quinone reductase